MAGWVCGKRLLCPLSGLPGLVERCTAADAGRLDYGMLHFHAAVPGCRQAAIVVLILAIGAVAVVLAVTRFDPIATTGGAPVSLLNSPDLATVRSGQRTAPFLRPKPVAEYTLPRNCTSG